MARKSRKVDYVNVGNKENLVTEAENQCEKVSHAALYARLSYESEKNRERNTIERSRRNSTGCSQKYGTTHFGKS